MLTIVEHSPFTPDRTAVVLLTRASKDDAKKAFSALYGSARTNGGIAFETACKQAQHNDYLTDALQPTERALADLERVLKLAPDNLRPVETAKLAAVASTARMTPEMPQALQLLHLPTAISCFVSHAFAPTRFRGLQKTKSATVSASVRAIAEQQLVALNPPASPSRPDRYPPRLDPTVVDLFLAASHYEGPDVAGGFWNLLNEGFHRTLTRLPANNWRSLMLATAREPMSKSKPAPENDLAFVSVLETATRDAAARATSGWLPISEAFDSFSQVRRLPIGEFKTQLAEAALDGDVELSPLNVASMLPALIRERSETAVGGRTFHFLRISTRRSAA